MADEARAGCPAWGTLFAGIEDDAKEIGHEFIRLLMQQTAGGQAETLPDEALITDIGEVAQSIWRREADGCTGCEAAAGGLRELRWRPDAALRFAGGREIALV